MAAPAVKYDQDQYDHLIAKCQDVADNLHAGLSSGKEPLGPDLLLQPKDQTWRTGADLVDAGHQFFSALDHASNGHLSALDRLNTLHDGLVKARSIFQSADQDLTAISSTAFSQLAPGLGPS